MRRRWTELERGRSEAVWEATRPTFTKQVAGPHFEAVCRDFAAEAEGDLFGDLPAEVGSGVVNDPAARGQIEIDVVVLAAQDSNAPRRILCLGEAKWGEVMGTVMCNGSNAPASCSQARATTPGTPCWPATPGQDSRRNYALNAATASS